MTYQITFLKAGLIHSETRTNDEQVKNLVVANGETRGFQVVVTELEH